jgi:predicted translin family RNA/ssDNA-binding protein
MLNKKYLNSVRTDLLTYAEKRRDVIKNAGDAQHRAKRAIFALQRDAVKDAATSLSEAQELLSGVYKKYKSDSRLLDEGSYRAALEEFVEAFLFQQFLSEKEMGEVKGLPIDSEIFIAGLCDVPGELLRYAIKSATARDFKKAMRCHEAAEAIIGELVDMNLTGYQRQKFDQAKQALHKLQEVVYETSLRS